MRIGLARFRRHWLDVHGPLVCAFPGLRGYVQCHVVDSLAANEAGLTMRIDGFPILYFNSDEDRMRAHGSPEMAACNVDSRQFVGAVSRVIADATGQPRTSRGRFSLIEIWPEGVTPPPRPMHYKVREQGAAPNSTIPHLPVTVGAMTQTWYDSLVDLECAAACIDRFTCGTIRRRGTLVGLTNPSQEEARMKVGFIGVGMMGAGMASNMQKGGNEVVVNDLTRQAASRHLNAGATWAETPKDVATVAMSCSPRCRHRPTCRKLAPVKTG